MGDWFRKHRADYPENWDEIANLIKTLAEWHCAACDRPHGRESVLTVHHVSRVPSDCSDANLVALCARCHLRAHSRRYRHLDKPSLIAELRRRHEIEIGQLCLVLLPRR